ncbi:MULTISPECIES: TRAP transporter large permease [Halomonadaceae]|jgi:tripartite ATP-independent transporter DctM subunit|uniref:TRAP transporter large permease protein n=1 Tax=Billgrantia aerodenitrificans TaxID=2733483 RepID=A0ABS9AUJ7_9GAMM|nr:MULTISPECIES: TRAP transporter large permease [Halomonas]MCE8025410.1 TRAP transporter large permease [Halomonas aerodenitrificans]MCE8037558.1 TRAP transporter large permease [Halomonas sp. MCCC 1A11062]
MGLIILGIFLVLFLLGFPVVYAILIPSAIYVLLEGLPLGLMGQRVTYALDSFPLVAVPIFIFVGNLMNQAGITDRIFHFANTLVGRAPGGLAQVNIFSSLIFSGMSGASLADVGGLGKIEIEAMKKRGYGAPFSAAVTASSAVVGPIFPPSIPLIVYGSVTSVSIVQLLLAGIVPALICIVLLMITAALLALRHDMPRAERWPTLMELNRAFIPALPALLAPVLMISGMLMGLFTPTEAAAVTAAYVVFISAVLYRELTWSHLMFSLLATLRTTSAILIIVAAAAMFGWILSVEQIPQRFAAFILQISHEPLMLLLIANLIFLIAGIFLDSTTATLLIVPIVAPPMVLAGVDPVHLGIVCIFNLMIGLLTPPMGLSLFLVSSIAKVSLRQLLKALIPFYIPLVATLAIITFAADLVLWLPSFMR